MGEIRSMSSDYIKQLEEDNWNLKNRLEQFETRCEWLEKLRLFRSTSMWSGNSVYQIGVNNYKSPPIGVFDAFTLPSDKKMADIISVLNTEIIRSSVFSENNLNKTSIKHKYDLWRHSITYFILYGKHIFDNKEYSHITKTTLTTSVHLSLFRLCAETMDYKEFDNPENDKDIFQSVNIVMTRGERLPNVRVTLRKTIDGFHNNVKFMGFKKEMRDIKNILEAIENLEKAQGDMDRNYDETH
jgi:hypothetical protein